MEKQLSIDAHQHFWIFDPKRDTWMDPESMSAIRRDFLPEDLLKLMEAAEITHTIAVQADQSEQETKFLLRLAEQYDFIAGVVGWIDLKSPELVERMQALEHPKLVGYRHVLQGEDPGFISDPTFIKGVQQVGQNGLTYDILVYADQLEEVITLVDQCPAQSLIIDHIAKPNIKNAEIESWEKQIRALAFYPNVYCKLSGMITEANWHSWSFEDLLPYLDVVLDAFGSERCLFGSDWPVCTLAGNYDEVHQIMTKFIHLRKLDGNAIFTENARKFYQLQL